MSSQADLAAGPNDKLGLLDFSLANVFFETKCSIWNYYTRMTAVTTPFASPASCFSIYYDSKSRQFRQGVSFVQRAIQARVI